MTTTGGTVGGQLDLFGGAIPDAEPEPVLMALHAEYYDLIWQRLKTHEFRRRFLEGRAVRWFVYLNAPVSRLAAVIDLGPAVAAAPEEVAQVAERMRPGNGASVLEYVRDLDRAFAIPILAVTEYPGLSAGELRAELGAFHPPQGYVRLAQHPVLMAVCEKVTAGIPIRSITVHHRLYRFVAGVSGQTGGWWLPVPARPSRSLRQGSPLRQARRARNWTLERTVEEIDLRTPGALSGREPGRHVTSIGHRAMLCEVGQTQA